jgi:hypothetical protein
MTMLGMSALGISLRNQGLDNTASTIFGTWIGAAWSAGWVADTVDCPDLCEGRTERVSWQEPARRSARGMRSYQWSNDLMLSEWAALAIFAMANAIISRSNVKAVTLQSTESTCIDTSFKACVQKIK